MPPPNGLLPRPLRIALLAALALAVFWSLPSVLRLGDYIRQVNPLSGQRQVEQDFTPTARELACLAGEPLPHEPPPAAVGSPPMPNVVHFVFLQRLPLGAKRHGDFDFLAYLAVRSAVVSLRPDRVLLHYGYTAKDPALVRALADDPFADENPWVARLRPHVELVRHAPPPDGSLRHPEHLADTLRLDILLEHGGIYLDTDSYALRPFTRLLAAPPPHDVVLGNEGGNRAGLCNAVVAARPNSTFVRRWRASYDGADLNREWNYHSVILPKQLAAAHPREVCELPPDAFFWPTWTWRHVDWMHKPMGSAEARFWQRRIDLTGGSLLDNQLAYHAWSQMARDRFLKRLTPDVVRREDTRFNLLMRRFLDDDV